MAEDKKQATRSPTPPSGSPPTVTVTGAADAPDPNEGPGKGKAFFDRAKSVAATGNYDYAIEMYIQGLHKEPFNMEEHKALREVAFRRKVAGGKSGGGLLGIGGAKLPYKGKIPKEALLNNEFTLARDVGNISAMLAMTRNADLLKLRELVLWIGDILREANRTNKSPKLEIYTELADIFSKHEEYARALEAINGAIELKPNDTELQALANEYAARETMKRGKYTQGGSFTESIKDVEKTKELLQEENLARSEEYRRKVLAVAKADYDANPKELQVITKYAKALQEMEDEDHENRAIEILSKAYTDTKIYRLKFQIGDIRMNQFKRNLRVMNEAAKSSPDDQEMADLVEQIKKDRLAYELREYIERAEHMPTDLDVRYELGMRYWQSKKYDDAIVAFQEAQSNAKRRVDALHYLGRSFLHQGMKPEAVETLSRSIEEYDLATTGDTKSKTLHYWYGRALEENKQLQEAIDVYSKVVRWEMRFLDARKHLDDLRAQLGK